MTKADIDAVLERFRTWPAELQQDAAHMLLELEGEGTGVYRLTEEDRREIGLSQEEMRRGEFASDEEVAAVFNRYRGK